MNKVEALNYNLRSLFEQGRFEAASGDARKTWNLYKEILHNKFQDKPDPTITINGAAIDDSVASCNVVNERFCSAGETLTTDIISVRGYDTSDIDTLYVEHANNNWSFQKVTADDVSSGINRLPNKKTTGIDKVPIQLLKATIMLIVPILAFCINMAIETTVFPFELLKGRLKLVHKSGDFDIENFRGLTILPAISKVFEELLVNQLLDYFDHIKLFVGNQFGFLRHSSCTDTWHVYLWILSGHSTLWILSDWLVNLKDLGYRVTL